MDFDKYQELARRTASDGACTRSEMMFEATLGVTGEAGEIADHLKKYLYQGHDIDYDHIAEEAGDLLWYIALLADALGVSMESIARDNIAKLEKRYPYGFDPERSINRD